MATDLSDLRRRLSQGLPQEAREVAEEAPGALSELKNKIMRRDPAVSSAGIPSWQLRAGLSRADTPEERGRFLDQTVGRGAWTQDAYGRYALLPEAAQRFGVQSDKPVVIDEGGLSRYDIADLSGSLPGIGGAMAMAPPMAAKGAALGAPFGPAGAFLGGAGGGILGAALGGAGGRGYQEAYEALAGENVQTAPQVAGTLAGEAGQAAMGEALFQGALRPLGRKLLAPAAKRMTPEKSEQVREALDLGVTPRATAISGAPLAGRMQTMFEAVGGYPKDVPNTAALQREFASLIGAGGRSLGRKAAGETIQSNILSARKALSKWAANEYDDFTRAVEASVPGGGVFPTTKLKREAADLLSGMPQAEGRILLANRDLVRSLKEVMDLPDAVSLRQLQNIRNTLWESIQDNTIVPGMTSGMARRLHKAASSAIDDIADDPRLPAELGSRIKGINASYRHQIRQFDSHLVNRITRDPKLAGALDPEQVADVIFKPRNSRNITRVMGLLPKRTKEGLRREAMEKILAGNVVKRGDDPTQKLWDGRALLNALDEYGEDSLKAMFGADLTRDLYRFGRVAQTAQMKTKGASGGIVAANLALHPIANFPKLMQINVLSRYMASPTGLKHFTTGLEAPHTRRGISALTRAAVQLGQMAEENVAESVPQPAPQR